MNLPLILVTGGAAVLVSYRWYHQPRLLIVATVLWAIGLALLMGRHKLFWHVLGVLSLSLTSIRCWGKGETFGTFCGAATAVFGVIQFFRAVRSRDQLREAQAWPKTNGEWGPNYVTDDARVICYGYHVEGGYYSGTFSAGSTLTRGLKSQLDDLKGKSVFVRFKPQQPEISMVFTSDQIESPN